MSAELTMTEKLHKARRSGETLTEVKHRLASEEEDEEVETQIVTPDMSWTKDQLRSYCEDVCGIDTTGLTNKKKLLAAINYGNE